MPQWNHTIHLHQWITDAEDHETVQKEMTAIADAIERDAWFAAFDRDVLKRMRAIPEGDEYFDPTDYANKLIAAVYDYADEHRIWIA